MRVDADLAIRAGVLQGVLVTALALLLIVVFPGDFFEDWGWLSGPLAWLACAGVTAWRLTLPIFVSVIGAAVAGVPMMLVMALGAHWLGVLAGVILFAAWCGTLEPRVPRRPTVPERRRSAH